MFQRPQFHKEEAENYLENKTEQLAFENDAPPMMEMFQCYFSKMPAVSPGPDGIPITLWLGAGFASAQTMQAVYSELAMGERMFFHFNASTISFTARKNLAEDDVELVRAPKGLRTVNQKNCDPEACAWVANRTLATSLAAHISPAQRGFIKGRQFVHNIIEIDAGARAADLRQVRGAVVPLDIENAFPA